MTIAEVEVIPAIVVLDAVAGSLMDDVDFGLVALAEKVVLLNLFVVAETVVLLNAEVTGVTSDVGLFVVVMP